MQVHTSTLHQELASLLALASTVEKNSLQYSSRNDSDNVPIDTHNRLGIRVNQIKLICTAIKRIERVVARWASYTGTCKYTQRDSSSRNDLYYWLAM